MLNQQVIRRRFDARELINRLKAGPCVDCANDRLLPCQKDFVRKDGSRSTVSRLLLRSQKAILAEIKLCDLVCANCSRLRVWNRQRARRQGEV